MIIVTCEWCGMTVDTIAYTVMAIKTDSNQPLHPSIRGHLHWDCLPNWVEYMRGDTPPPCQEKPLPYPPISEKRKTGGT